MSKPKKKGATQFPTNNHQKAQIVKENMHPIADGPTIDTFSSLDNTTDLKTRDTNNENSSSKTPKRRPSKTKPNNLLSKISPETWFGIIFSIVFTIISYFVGTVIYSHSNQLTAQGKDVENIKDDISDQKEEIDKIDERTISIDKKIDLLNQKVDFKTSRK